MVEIRSLTIKKEESNQRNPIILGTNQLKDDPLLSNNLQYITIDSVDLHGIILVKDDLDQRKSNVHVEITNAEIHLSREKDFIISRKTHIELNIRKSKLYGARHWIKSSGSEKRYSKITITNCTIENGSFATEHFQFRLLNSSLKFSHKIFYNSFYFINSAVEFERCNFLIVQGYLKEKNVITLEKTDLAIISSKIHDSTFADFIVSRHGNNSISLKHTHFNNVFSHNIVKTEETSTIFVEECTFVNSSIMQTMFNGNSSIFMKETLVKNIVGMSITNQGSIICVQSKFLQNQFNTICRDTSTSLERCIFEKNNIIGSFVDNPNSLVVYVEVKACQFKENHLRYGAMFSLKKVNHFVCHNTSFTDNYGMPLFQFNQVEGKVKGLSFLRNKYNLVKKDEIYYNDIFTAILLTELTKTSKSQLPQMGKDLMKFTKSKLSIVETHIEENHCKNYIYASDRSEVILRRTTFRGNISEESGKLIKLLSSTATIDNVVVTLHKNWNSFEEQYQPRVNFLTPGFIVHSLTINTEKPYQDSNVVFAFLKTTQLKNMSINCIHSYWPKVEQQEDDKVKISCNACPDGMFSFSNGKIANMKVFLKRISEESTKLDISYHEKSKYEVCENCPYGGQCSGREITSRDNFYGFVSKKNDNKKVAFIPCIEKYCCSKDTNPCTSIKSCGINRSGRFCGQCRKSFFLSYFTNNCLPKDLCTKSNRQFFWLLYWGSIFLTSVILIFAKDFKEMVKSIAGSIKEIIGHYFRTRKHDKLKRMATEIHLNELHHDETTFIEKNDCTRKVNKGQGNKQINQEQTFSISATFGILLSFYQLKSTFAVKTEGIDNTSFIEKLFNVDLIKAGTEEIESLCPTHSIDAVLREIFKGYFSSLSMLSNLILAYIISKIVDRFSPLKGKSYTSEACQVGYCLVNILLQKYFQNCIEFNQLQNHGRRNILIH